MPQTVPAEYLNSPATGYVYVALLSQSSQEKITGLLEKLAMELPDVIWPMPQKAMHVTLCEIVQSRKSYSENKDTLYARRRQEYEVGAAEVLCRIPKFGITLDHIEVSPDAIIVRSGDGSMFNDIREKLLGRITLPEETKRPPNIIHSSIARYTKSVQMERVQAAVAKHTIEFKEPITEFKLLKTLVPPLLKYEELRSYLLS